MIESIEMYILLFFTYSLLGWMMESIGGILVVKKFVNRGFLIGPYCPVYGTGVVIISILLQKYINDLPVLFILSMVICGVLEYATSYVMEKLFNARWWDYTKKRFNINGRICLENLVLFAIAGSVILCIINPFFINIFLKIPIFIRHIITGILSLLFIVDVIISFNIISSFKNETYKERDNTEEIGNKVKDKTEELGNIVKNKAEDVLMKAESDAIVFRRRIKVKKLRIQRAVKYRKFRGVDTTQELAEKIRKQREIITEKLLDKKEELEDEIKFKKANWEMKQKENKEILDRKIQKTKENFENFQKTSFEKIDNKIRNIRNDSEEFTKKVVEKFKAKSILRKRLMEAFPKLEVKQSKDVKKNKNVEK